MTRLSYSLDERHDKDDSYAFDFIFLCLMAMLLHNPIDCIVLALVSEFGQATDNEVK